ncbi:MAG: hypothetical protein OWQ54_08730 [Sulfolobaceae archaeon]|nr:hypothetical protein [Sulfolobaceae archaeon]
MEKSNISGNLLPEDLHMLRFGKRFDEVVYLDDYVCPICHSRIDEFGYCACDAHGD